VQATSDERRESLNSTQSNGEDKARRGSNSSSGHGSIGSGTDPHAQTWTAIQTARSELDKGAKAKKVSEKHTVFCVHFHSFLYAAKHQFAYCKHLKVIYHAMKS
jgi:hypothetical protein